MELNEKLQMLRKQKGLTQEQLAAELYVSRTAISKWESGRGYPSIDSLKALARFYNISIDELLSGEQLLTVVEEDNRNKANRLRRRVFGLLDLSAVLLFFFPFFGQEAEGGVCAVSLLALNGIATYLRVLYMGIIIGLTLLGVLMLALQNKPDERCAKCVFGASLGLHLAGELLFILGRQPYAAVFLLVLLRIKSIFLMKKQ
ncbi:MAG: helix-turn-helix transcriptional regulator [Clostridia bacterium]|nr:helix-turn-helix transcriptional regulator [Clostridia bacterium]